MLPPIIACASTSDDQKYIEYTRFSTTRPLGRGGKPEGAPCLHKIYFQHRSFTNNLRKKRTTQRHTRVPMFVFSPYTYFPAQRVRVFFSLRDLISGQALFTGVLLPPPGSRFAFVYHAYAAHSGVPDSFFLCELSTSLPGSSAEKN